MTHAQWSRLEAIRRSTVILSPARCRAWVEEHAEILRRIAAGAPAAEIEHAARAHKQHAEAAAA